MELELEEDRLVASLDDDRRPLSPSRDFDDYVITRGAELLRLARLFCGGDRALSQDLVQTTLMKAWGSWGRVSASDNPHAYVKKILYRATIDWRRRRWTSEVIVDEPHMANASEPAEPGSSDDAATNIDLWRIVRQLPQRQRTVVVLRFYEHLTEAQVAETLGISLGSVKTHSSRALKALRSAYSNSEEMA